VVTQEHTSSLEDLICRRIKDGSFDDVLPPEQQPRQRRDYDAELSQEKSSRGLGEVTHAPLSSPPTDLTAVVVVVVVVVRSCTRKTS
jgi:U3 small nucleolar ribonucleoprotein component